MHLLLKWHAKACVTQNFLPRFPSDVAGSSWQTYPVLCMRSTVVQGACEHATDEYLAAAAPSTPLVDLVVVLPVILPSRAMGKTSRPRGAEAAAPTTVSARP